MELREQNILKLLSHAYQSLIHFKSSTKVHSALKNSLQVSVNIHNSYAVTLKSIEAKNHLAHKTMLDNK